LRHAAQNQGLARIARQVGSIGLCRGHGKTNTIAVGHLQVAVYSCV